MSVQFTLSCLVLNWWPVWLIKYWIDWEKFDADHYFVAYNVYSIGEIMQKNTEFLCSRACMAGYKGCSYVIFFKRRNDVKCYDISALNCVRTLIFKLEKYM